MKNNAKTKAKKFLSEYKINKLTLEDLCRIIKLQGYTIVEYNQIFNDENVAKLIDALGVQEAVDKSRGFTYADNQRRLVFLHEDLSDAEKLLVLAHEEGHIYCGHLSSAPIIGKDVVEEHEAGEFTHYILNRSIAERIGGFVKKNKKICGVVAIILAVIIVASLIFGFVKDQQSYYGEYYITASGNKYHEEMCIFVKDKTNTHRMTIEEYESGDYQPCGICLPHSNNTEGGD